MYWGLNFCVDPVGNSAPQRPAVAGLGTGLRRRASWCHAACQAETLASETSSVAAAELEEGKKGTLVASLQHMASTVWGDHSVPCCAGDVHNQQERCRAQRWTQRASVRDRRSTLGPCRQLSHSTDVWRTLARGCAETMHGDLAPCAGMAPAYACGHVTV